MRRLFCALVLAVLTAPALRAENGVRPGEFIVEPPTLICLGFEWAISGDDNRKRGTGEPSTRPHRPIPPDIARATSNAVPAV